MLRKFTVSISAVLCAFTFAQAATYSGGDGSPANPYQISTREHLEAVNNDLSANYILLNDIDLSGTTYNRAVIAPNTGTSNKWEGVQFTGTFNGGGFAINNLTINGGSSSSFIGFFGYIDDDGIIKNLGLEDFYVKGFFRVGSIAGENNGHIDNCYSVGRTQGSTVVGGLVGYNARGSIVNSYTSGNEINWHYVASGAYSGGIAGFNQGSVIGCYSTGDISSGTTNVAGGLVAVNDDGLIRNCYSTGNISTGFDNMGQTSGVGGLVGVNENNGNIFNSYATGNISSYENIGGLVGYNRDSTIRNSYSTGTVIGKYGGSYYNNAGGLVGQNLNGIISNCYAKGSVDGVKNVGGLIGNNWGESFVVDCYAVGYMSGYWNEVGGLCGSGSGSVINSFWDRQTTGQYYSSGGTGKSTAEMQDVNTFLSAGWDFVVEEANGVLDIWMIKGGQYPQHYFFSEGYQPRNLTGEGTPQNPYLISDKYDLYAVNQDNIASYRLVSDIDMADIIFNNCSIIVDFSGEFDGAGFVISNLTISADVSSEIGLFNTVKAGGIVKNLGLENLNILGDLRVGGLSGTNYGMIENCYTKSNIAGNGGVGGLVGRNYSSEPFRLFSRY